MLMPSNHTPPTMLTKQKWHHIMLNPTPIITAYSNRFSSDMLDLIQSMSKVKGENGAVRIEDVYKEYVRGGRRGGIVYIEATRWENLGEFGRWLHENKHGEWEESMGVISCKGGMDEVRKEGAQDCCAKEEEVERQLGG